MRTIVSTSFWWQPYWQMAALLDFYMARWTDLFSRCYGVFIANVVLVSSNARFWCILPIYSGILSSLDFSCCRSPQDFDDKKHHTIKKVRLNFTVAINKTNNLVSSLINKFDQRLRLKNVMSLVKIWFVHGLSISLNKTNWKVFCFCALCQKSCDEYRVLQLQQLKGSCFKVSCLRVRSGTLCENGFISLHFLFTFPAVCLSLTQTFNRFKSRFDPVSV